MLPFYSHFVVFVTLEGEVCCYVLRCYSASVYMSSIQAGHTQTTTTTTWTRAGVFVFDVIFCSDVIVFLHVTNITILHLQL